MVLGRPTRPSSTNTKKRCPFHHRGLECKSKRLRDTQTNREVWPWSTKWSRAKTSRALWTEYTDYTKHPLSTTQEMNLHINIPRWSTPKSDWLYSLQWKMDKLYKVSKTKLGVDCGSDHQFLIVKIKLKLKKVGKTTRPFRYDLNPFWLYSGGDEYIQGIRSCRQSAWRTMNRVS